SEQEAYLAGQSVCGLSVGDRVRVVRKAISWEMGWTAAWSMQHKFGFTGEIVGITTNGFRFKDRDWNYPYFVLERIETPAEATPVETPAEVAPEIDPGPEHRLIDVKKDIPMKGDEVLVKGTWQKANNHMHGFPFTSLPYRRR